MASSSRITCNRRLCRTCNVYGTYHDSQLCRIKQEFTPPSSVLKVPKSEPQTLSPDSIPPPILEKNELEISKQDPLVGTQEDPAFWAEVVSFCDSISAIDHSITPNPTFLTPSSLLGESSNTLMYLEHHNPWEDELSWTLITPLLMTSSLKMRSTKSLATSRLLHMY
ncbi:hypothetical protein L1987_37960 [Smallanthus sonchifolius]|uniref:Uncharacterized protein n=1 Tax=Smallanthus sonchifolius TaxID=185202 RepID=A0ACB9HHC3_9ASTR|nr:hypothetical protein L1987_37960 [Smallanthus sonchifolius]